MQPEITMADTPEVTRQACSPSAPANGYAPFERNPSQSSDAEGDSGSVPQRDCGDSSHGWNNDLPEYQEFLSECAKQCRCSMTICESVLCGAPCEERIEPDDYSYGPELDDNLP